MRLALATHELMENAVRHNSGTARPRLVVERRDVEGEKRISVRISNPAWPEDIDRLSG